MKIGILISLSILAGYILGTFFPAYDFFFPKREIEFETNYTIESGSRAYSRFFDSSMGNGTVPIEITIHKNDATKLKFVSDSEK
jgi:hypothetical protein